MTKLYQILASAMGAYHRCAASGNAEWERKHLERAQSLTKEFMPSGSGVDCGTEISLNESNDDKLVFTLSFHHMNDGGMYDGWTDHTVTVTPAFSGFHLRISGRNRNQIKDYLGDLLHEALNTEISEASAALAIR